MESDDKRCYLTFGGHFNDECAYTEYCIWGREVYDSYWVFKSEQCSNCLIVENCYRTFFSSECNDCIDTYFSFDCRNCMNIIGCAGLRNKSYCIFNKQYTKEEYFNLLGEIKKHMIEMPFVSKITGKRFSYGDFFSDEHALFHYNETIANDFYPKRKDEAEKEGFTWSKEEDQNYIFSNYIIPDNIKDVEDNILEITLKCEKTGKGYKITRRELDYYRKINLPIPRVAPLARIRSRIIMLPPFRFFNRKCEKCKNDIQTSYAPDRPEIIYCESCYNKEVY